MNHPFTYGKYSFSQSGCDTSSDGRNVSILNATQDPGLFLKYLGSVTICGGIALAFLTKIRFSKK